MANVAEKVFALIKPAVESCGTELWDVRYLKEGASWYLRVFIDKADGVNIDDCTAVSHAIDPIIDEADPISDAYYLEVCSPGIERELTRPEHFEKTAGQKIKIKLYKALNGTKEINGTLLKAENGIIEIDAEGEILSIGLKEISKANLCDFE